MIEKMSNEQLEKEFLEYDDIINVSECYSVKDVIWLDRIEQEILNRGGSIKTNKTIVFREVEE